MCEHFSAMQSLCLCTTLLPCNILSLSKQQRLYAATTARGRENVALKQRFAPGYTIVSCCHSILLANYASCCDCNSHLKPTPSGKLFIMDSQRVGCKVEPRLSELVQTEVFSPDKSTVRILMSSKQNFIN